MALMAKIKDHDIAEKEAKGGESATCQNRMFMIMINSLKISGAVG